MLFKNKLALASIIGVLFIASCSNEMAVESSGDTSGGGKAYAEFMACTAGPDFNAENAMKMIADWQKLITADSLLGAWGYVPAADTNAFGETLGWELNWSSKEEADSEWAAGVQNVEGQAWNEEYSNVMVCDGEGRNAFDADYPIAPGTYGSTNESGYFYSEFYQCNYNEGSGRSDAEAFLPGYVNAVSNSDFSDTNYSFGNYFAHKNADGSHVESDIDFLWATFTDSEDSMKKANESFEKDIRDEMFPLFSEYATCAEVPDVYHSWTFYNSDAKDFMPDFASRD